MFIFLLLLILLTESSNASSNGLIDELRFIHQEMGLLRAENHKQNAEMTSLKETVQSQNKTIHQHGTVIKELITSERKRMDEESVGNHHRNNNKRPVRLLPNFVLFPNRKNETDQQQNPNKFYGPPTNCSDLARLGYTLNGYYLVKPTIYETNIY